MSEKESVKQILNNQQIPVPSMLQSVVLWRKIFADKIPGLRIASVFKQQGFVYPGGNIQQFIEAYTNLYGSGLCPFCDSSGQRHDDPNVDGEYYCICELLREEERRIRPNAVKWGSYWQPSPVGLNMKKVAGKNGKKDVDRLIKAIDATREFIDNPDQWLMYFGKTGTGKTHMLSVIMQAWFPWAMYIVASDLEDKLRSMIGNGGDEISKFIHDLQTHPILVIDDWGLQHTTEWIQAKIDSIIEFRSRDGLWFDRLTIVATNFEPHNYKLSMERNDGVSRSGSRLSDRDRVLWLHITSPDYRELK